MVNDTTLAITLMNRHIDQSANVRIFGVDNLRSGERASVNRSRSTSDE